MVMDWVDGIDKLFDKYLPPKEENEIVRDFVLPRGADPENYKVVVVQGERICVHQDFSDLAVDESL